MIFSISVCILPSLLHGMPVCLAPILARRVILTCWCQGASALSLYWRQGASAFPLAIRRLVWPWARSMTMSRCKLTSHPLYAGMPLVGCLLLVGKKCSRPMGLNVLGGQEARFSPTGCHRIMNSQSAAGSSEAMEETDRTEVKYKIRQWSLPGATIAPVLNVRSFLAWIGWQSSLGQLFGATGGYPLWCVFAEVFSCVAGRSWRKAHSWYHAARPSRCGWLAELYVIAEEPYLYNSRNSHWGDLWTGLQQRAAQAAGQASVDGGQATVGGACWPNVRPSPHRPTGKSKKELDALLFDGPPDATALTHMKRKGIVGLESKKSRHGGSNARIGWHNLKNKVNPLSLTSRSCWRRYQTRKQ